jgi:hypothetical protein
LESLTKTKVSDKQIHSLARRAFGSEQKLETIVEFNEGFFNVTYGLTFAGGFKAVLKTAPSDETTIMQYEKTLMTSEVYTMNKICTIRGCCKMKVLKHPHFLLKTGLLSINC